VGERRIRRKAEALVNLASLCGKNCQKIKAKRTARKGEVARRKGRRRVKGSKSHGKKR